MSINQSHAGVKMILPIHLVEDLAGRLRDIIPGTTVVGVDPEGHLTGDASDAVGLFRFFPNDRFNGATLQGERLRRVLNTAPDVRWIQTHGAGVDGLLVPEVFERNITITNGAGLHQVPVAESAFALMIAAAKRLPQHWDDQRRRSWRRLAKLELNNMTAVIFGLGRIGREVAVRCKAFGMNVIGVRRTVPAEAGGDPQEMVVDRLIGASDFPVVVPEADFVVLTAALNPGTRGIIDEKILCAMKPTSYLVNVARGEMVDEDALVQALREGRIAGACLDVFMTEPLPSDNPLYDLDNVILTPHNSASNPHMNHRVLELFLDNFMRFARGEPLRNSVDLVRGY